ncbi:MAG: hypothetical protein WC314_03085 [Vulcanimicrobiota bacterium]
MVVAQPPTEAEIKDAVNFFPENRRKEVLEILDFYQDIYPTYVDQRCAIAANNIELALDERFKQNPRDRERFKDFTFGFSSYEHPWVGSFTLVAPTNYTTVTVDEKTIYLYTGSDRIYFWLNTPRISPAQRWVASMKNKLEGSFWRAVEISLAVLGFLFALGLIAYALGLGTFI